MFEKLEINKFEGLYSSVAPEVIKDGQARDILNFRMEKIGKLVSRDGYIFGLFTHDITVPDSNSSVTDTVFANNGGIIGLGEIILEKKWSDIDTDRLMVYAVRAEKTPELSIGLGDDNYGKYEIGGELPKSNCMAYLFSPITGKYANTLMSNADVAATYGSGNGYMLLSDFHHSIDKTAQGKPITAGHTDSNGVFHPSEVKTLLAPNKQLPSYGDNEYSTADVLGVKHLNEKYDDWINHYIQMSQYRHKLIVSDRTNGDHIIEDEANRDSDRVKGSQGQWTDVPHGLHIRPNELETFDIDIVKLGLRQREYDRTWMDPHTEITYTEHIKEENVEVENGMGLYKYVLPKDNYIMSTENESGPLSNPKSYIQDPSADLVALQRSFNSSTAKFAMAYVTRSKNEGHKKGYAFKYNSEPFIYSNADSTNEYDNILGTLELEEQEWEDEDGNVIKSKVSDVYVWEDYRINYKPSSGMDLTSMLLTDASRFFDMTSANARIKELNAVDPLGRNVPLSVWQYRFVWEFGDGSYSAPSALLQAPDAIYSAIDDAELKACVNKQIRPGVDGEADEGYKEERPRKLYELNQLCTYSQRGAFEFHTELFHTLVIKDTDDGFRLNTAGLGVKLFQLKDKLYGTAQNRFGTDRGVLSTDVGGKYTGEITQDGKPWTHNDYGDFACIVAVSPVPDVVTTKGVFWEGAAVNTAKWGWEDGSLYDDAAYWLDGKTVYPMEKIDSSEKHTSCNNGFLKVPVFMDLNNPSLTYYSLFDTEGNLRMAWQGKKTFPCRNADVGVSIIFPGFNPQAILKKSTDFLETDIYDADSGGTLYSKRTTIPEMIYCKSNLPDYGGVLWREDNCYLFVVPNQYTDNITGVIKVKTTVRVQLWTDMSTGLQYWVMPNATLEPIETYWTVDPNDPDPPPAPLTMDVVWTIDVDVTDLSKVQPLEFWTEYAGQEWITNHIYDCSNTIGAFFHPGDQTQIQPWNEEGIIGDIRYNLSLGTNTIRPTTFFPEKQDNGGRPTTVIKASKESRDSFNNYDGDVDNEVASRLIGQGILHLNPLAMSEFFTVRSEFDCMSDDLSPSIHNGAFDRFASDINLRRKFYTNTMHALDGIELYAKGMKVDDLFYTPVNQSRTNLDVHVYMPATRFYGIEQLTSYFPASQLFQAPRLGIHIEQADVPKRAKALLIFRTIATHSNDWDPDSFGLVERLEIDRDADGLAITYRPDTDPNQQTLPYSGIYYFDDVKDKNLDFSDSPDRYDGLRKAIFSRFNIPLNERLYYANFTEVYQSLKPRGMVGDANDIKNINLAYVDAGIGRGAPEDKTVGKSISYRYYLVHLNEDDKLSVATEIVSDNSGNNIKPATGQAVVLYYIPHKYDGTIKETRIYRSTVDDNGGGSVISPPKLVGRVENNEFGIFVDDFSFIGADLDCTEPNKANYESGIRWSEPYSPDWIKLNNFAEVGSGDGDQITGLVTIAGNLVVFKENSIWRLAVQGDDPPISRTDLITPDCGCIAPGALITLDNVVYFLSWDGLKVYDNNIPQSIDTPFAEELKLLLQTVPVQHIRDAQMGYNQGTGEIYLNIPVPAPPDIDLLPKPRDIATTDTIWTEHNNGVAIASPATEIKVMSDYYNVDVAMDIENFGNQDVRHRRQQYGHIFIINLKKGYASKFGYPATRILNGTSPQLDVLTQHPLQLVRMYYSNSLGEFRSADISTRRYAYDYNTATNMQNGARTGFYFAGMYIESPYMSFKPTQVITGSQGNPPVGSFVLQNKLYADHDVIPASRYIGGQFPTPSYVPIRSMFRSKFFTSDTEFGLKRVRKVLANLFAKSNFRVDGITYHYEGFDSRIDPNSPILSSLLQRFYYPPTDSDVNITTMAVTIGSGRNIVTFVPSSNGTDWYGKPIKFAVDIYSEKRTQLNALEIFWRTIHKYLL